MIPLNNAHFGNQPQNATLVLSAAGGDGASHDYFGEIDFNTIQTNPIEHVAIYSDHPGAFGSVTNFYTNYLSVDHDVTGVAPCNQGGITHLTLSGLQQLNLGDGSSHFATASGSGLFYVKTIDDDPGSFRGGLIFTDKIFDGTGFVGELGQNQNITVNIFASSEGALNFGNANGTA